MSNFYVGLDVGDQTTAMCIVNEAGERLLETSVPTTPAAIVDELRPYRRMLHRVGLEAGSKSAWLYDALTKERFPVICLDARDAHAALSARPNKSDKTDARGIAILLCRGLFTATHVRSVEARKIRLLLLVRKTLQRKAIDLKMCAHMSEKMLGDVNTRGKRPGRSCGQPDQRRLLEILNRCSDMLRTEFTILDKLAVRTSRSDPVCRRLMAIPGVGPIVALSFRAAIDDPARFKSSQTVGAYFGLTPRSRQSGQSFARGRISRMGDRSVRTALVLAALAMFRATRSNSALRQWGLALATRKPKKLAVVACARKLSVLMHRQWMSDQRA